MSLYHIPHSTTCLSGAWSMKGLYVQQWGDVCVGQKRLTDLIVYSEVLCFQVTLALMGIIVSSLDVYCRRQRNKTAAKNKSKIFADHQKPDKNCRLRTQKNRGILFVYVPHWSALSPLQTSFWIKDRTSSDICVTACGPELCLQSLCVFLNVNTILHWSVQWCVQIHIDVNPHGNGLHSVSPP